MHGKDEVIVYLPELACSRRFHRTREFATQLQEVLINEITTSFQVRRLGWAQTLSEMRECFERSRQCLVGAHYVTTSGTPKRFPGKSLNSAKSPSQWRPIKLQQQSAASLP